MDACNPGIDAKNLARLVRQETGVELNLNRNQVCDVYKSIQDGKLPLPPMVLTKDGKYMLDRKSPLTSSDFEVLFSSSSKSNELKRVARKVGLSNYKDMTKAELVDAIENVLKSNNVREPVRLHITAPKKKRISVNSNNNNNNNYQNNFNVNNRNGNGVKNNNNLKRISNESNNLGNRENRNRENRNRGNENRENRNRGNKNRENGNRENGNRGNATPRPPNRTARNKYYMAAAARRVGGNRVQPPSTPSDPTMAGLINALRKSRNSSNTASLTRALERAKSGSSSTNTKALARQVENALKRGNTTTLNALRKKLAVQVVSEKDKKMAELEKYIVNKGSKLDTQRRVAFMNDAQKTIKGYKNGTNIYNTAKTRITAAYETAYKAQLNDMGAQKALEELQKTLNTIGNIKIKSSAREKLNAFKQSGGTDTSARNAVIKLKKLDEELGKRNVNRVYLNAVRDEALKNINSYNINNGLAKIDTQVQQEKNERGLKINELIKNDAYKNIPSTIKTSLRNQYVSGEKKINDVKRDLDNALETSAGVFKGLENKIQNLQTKLNNSKLTANERNALKAERNNLKQKLNQNALNMNKKAQNIQILKKQKENANGEIKKLKNKLNTNKSLSNGEKTALQEQLNNAMKNRTNLNNRLRKSEAEKMQYMREMNALAENVRKQKEKANAEIAELTKKLKNGSISNAERKKLENELAEARGNVLIKNEELQKLQKEKKSFNAEIAKAKQNVEAARAAQSAANRNRNAQVANARSQANEATQQAQAAEAVAVTAQKQLTQAQASLAEQRANVNKLTQELQSQRSLTETQRRKLEEQILMQRKQVSNAQNAVNEARKYAQSATETSRRLVAEASAAANNASQRAQEAEQQKLLAQQAEQRALGNKAEANRLRLEANRLKAESNKARNAARDEAQQSAKAAAAANAEAKRIAQELEKANLTKKEMNVLIKEKNALLETRRKEMQNQINSIQKQANNKNNLISVLESNVNLAKQRLAVKNADLLKKIEQIKQTQSNVTRLQSDLNSEKATSAEKNKIKNQLEAETAKLMREKEMLEGSRIALTQQRNQFKKQLNMAEGGRIALMNKLRQLQSAKNISNKQRDVFREQLRKVQAQRRNLRGAVTTNQAQYATTRSQLDATQKNLAAARLNEQRAKQRIIEASRLAKNRASNIQNFNATTAFQQMGNKLTTNKNMWKRGVRSRWQNVAKPGAAYLKNQENLRVAKNTLRTLINSKRPNGNYTIGGPFGQKRRQLKSELDRVSNMTQLREIRKKITTAKNIKNTEVAQKRMNKTLSMAGSSTNNFKFGNRTQPIMTRGQLLTQNNRNNTKKSINALFRIGNKTKLQLKRRINMGENPRDVLRNAMSKNRKAGGPAAEARIRAQAYSG